MFWYLVYQFFINYFLLGIAEVDSGALPTSEIDIFVIADNSLHYLHRLKRMSY